MAKRRARAEEARAWYDALLRETGDGAIVERMLGAQERAEARAGRCGAEFAIYPGEACLRAKACFALLGDSCEPGDPGFAEACADAVHRFAREKLRKLAETMRRPRHGPTARPVEASEDPACAENFHLADGWARAQLQAELAPDRAPRPPGTPGAKLAEHEAVRSLRPHLHLAVANCENPVLFNHHVAWSGNPVHAIIRLSSGPRPLACWMSSDRIEVFLRNGSSVSCPDERTALRELAADLS